MSICVDPSVSDPDDELGVAIKHALQFLPGFKFGITNSRCPVILEAPVEAPEDSVFVCFFEGNPSRKDLKIHRLLLEALEDDFTDDMADVPKLDGATMLLLETSAHDCRCKAFQETDPQKQKKMLKRAFLAYEGVIMSEKNETQVGLISSIKKNMKKTLNPKFLVTTPIPNIERLHSDMRRFRSHVLAGLAVCVLISDTSLYGFFSFASAAMSWAPDKALELLMTLRVFFLMYIKYTLKIWRTTVPGYGELWSYDKTVSKFLTQENMPKFSLVLGKFVTALLVPLAMRLKRQDVVDHEMKMLKEFHIRDIQEVVGLLETKVSMPMREDQSSFPRCLISRVFMGKLIDPVCPNCGRFDTENKFKKCSACFLVLYCSRECQKAHWSTHKQECKKALSNLK